MDLRDVKEFLKDTFKYILTIVVVLVIIVYIASLQQIVGSSMMPNYQNKDIYLLEKYYYKVFDIERFDVVSLNYDAEKYLVKRIIGLPGEKVEYLHNDLYINNVLIEEEFMAQDEYTEDFKLDELGYKVIPEDMYLVLGDNRDDSLDSRDIGLIKKEDILGRIRLKIWPLF